VYYRLLSLFWVVSLSTLVPTHGRFTFFPHFLLIRVAFTILRHLFKVLRKDQVSVDLALSLGVKLGVAIRLLEGKIGMVNVRGSLGAVLVNGDRLAIALRSFSLLLILRVFLEVQASNGYVGLSSVHPFGLSGLGWAFRGLSYDKLDPCFLGLGRPLFLKYPSLFRDFVYASAHVCEFKMCSSVWTGVASFSSLFMNHPFVVH
jgi:hypothetical protein